MGISRDAVEGVIKILDEMGVFDRWVDRVAAAVVEKMPAPASPVARGDELRSQIFRHFWTKESGDGSVTLSELQALKIGNWYALKEEMARMQAAQLVGVTTRKLRRGITATDYHMTAAGRAVCADVAKQLGLA